MKLTNLILTVVLTLGLFAAVGIPAHAQQANQYTLTSTNPVAAGVTNPATILTVNEFDNAGLSIDSTPTTTNGGSLVVIVKKSGNGAQTFETVPSYTVSVSEATSGLTTVFTNLDLRGASHVSVAIGNSGSATVTNAVVINLKSPKFGAKAATR